MNETQALILEIVVIAAVILFFAALIGRYIYKKAKGLPTGECAMCHKSKKRLLKEYHEYCCCSDKETSK